MKHFLQTQQFYENSSLGLLVSPKHEVRWRGEERVVVVVSRAQQSHGWTGPSNNSLVKVIGHNEPRDSVSVGDSVGHHPLHPLATIGGLLGRFQ